MRRKARSPSESIRSDDLCALTFPADESLHARLTSLSEPHEEFQMEKGKLSEALYTYLLANHVHDREGEWENAGYRFSRIQRVIRLTFHSTERIVTPGMHNVEVSYFVDEYGMVIFHGVSAQIIVIGSLK